MGNENSSFLVTGASGMLGRYLLRRLAGEGDVTTLQRHDADIVCDLGEKIPCLGDKKFDTVFHLAGSCDESDAVKTNHTGTIHLLRALEEHPPKRLVFISSWEVYSPDSGEEVEEGHRLWAATKTGQSKATAETALREWSAEHGVVLTVLRPARMFGKGIKGEMKRMFSDVVSARYIHVRDNDARLSLVCAIDVAEAAARLRGIGGTFNVTDGTGTRWIDLADAMSANCGQMKRQTFLPQQWARTAWRFAPWLLAVKASLDPAVLARRSKTLTLSDTALRTALPDWNPYAAIDVIRRDNKDYPYED